MDNMHGHLSMRCQGRDGAVEVYGKDVYTHVFGKHETVFVRVGY